MKQLQLELERSNCPMIEIMQEEIRGLSWWQPFGSFMLYNKIECRDWATKYRGLVLICTTQKPWEKQPPDKKELYVMLKEHITEHVKCEYFETFQPYNTFTLNGQAIAVGRLTDCRKVKLNDLTYYMHPPTVFAHIYEDVKRIKPFPVKGGQGWFKVTPEMKSKIELL